MTRAFNPKLETLALYIRDYAKPLAFDVTYTDVAEALGVDRALVVSAVQYKGWATRFRVEVAYRFRGGNPYAAAYLAQAVAAGRIGYAP